MIENHAQPNCANRAFTLLELVVVIAIISLISGAGMSMASGALRAADRISTQEKLNTIKIALDSFGKTYGYLPCPAPLAAVPTDTTFGKEQLPASFPRACSVGSGIEKDSATTTVIKGGVPVRTLGLPDSYAADAWDGKLTYAVTTALTVDAKSYATTSGAIIVKSGTRTSPYTSPVTRFTRTYTNADNGSGAARLTLSADRGGLAVGNTVYIKGNKYSGKYIIGTLNGAANIDLNDASGVLTYDAADTGGTIDWQAVSTTTGDAAYIVISHGPDGRGAYPMNGTGVPATKPCSDTSTGSYIDVENCQTGTGANPFDNVFFDAAYNDGTTAAEYFDDYVVWGSNALLRNPPVPKLYFLEGSATTPACPTGVCESWCATCTQNYPGASSVAPPTTITNPVLCKKVITSTATGCKAYCFWSGTTAAGYQPCP